MALTRRAVADLSTIARLTRDLPRFLHGVVSTAAAQATVRQRLERRPERLLDCLDRLVFARPASPYARLLAAAGCEPGDVRRLVADEGVEGALARLAQAGVYVSFDEFKGRAAAIRGSSRFDFAERDFDNPAVPPHFVARSGGTRSAGTVVGMSLAFADALAANTSLALKAWGAASTDHATWLTGSVLPLLLYARLGHPPIAWFHPLRPLPRVVRLGSWYLAGLSRLCGRPLPLPAWIDLQDPARLARWLAARARPERPVCLTTYASSAVRTAAAASAAGLRLDGVFFITLGEPFTEAKRRVVDASGARTIVRYAFTEAGILGYGCPEGEVSDDLHFHSDCFGLIQQPRTVRDSRVTVDAFLFTSLLESAPKVLLNAESGDYGVARRRRCGCALGQAGLDVHVSTIRSHEKLTGEGMSFVKTQLPRVLEESLPARFGGGATDYQAVEEEDATGICRLVLLVSPAVGECDVEQVRQTFLDELAADGELEEYMATIWRRAGTVVVRRQEPIATQAGKILPFHLVKSAPTGVSSRPSSSSGAAEPKRR
ncbi:MAG: hypothetical protein IT307_01130 [Chloroflexi bacterium]|nr:hypothetical protein [Chloroflexota bacterium]